MCHQPSTIIQLSKPSKRLPCSWGMAVTAHYSLKLQKLMRLRHPGFYSLRIWQLTWAEGSPFRGSCITSYAAQHPKLVLLLLLLFPFSLSGVYIVFTPLADHSLSKGRNTDTRIKGLCLIFQSVKEKKKTQRKCNVYCSTIW